MAPRFGAVVGSLPVRVLAGAFGLFLLGVAFAAMGLVGVLFGGVGPRLRPWLMPLLAAAVLAPLGAAAALTDWPRPVWFPLAVLAQVCLFVAALAGGWGEFQNERAKE